MASGIYNFDLEYLASAIADKVKARLASKQDTLQLDVVPTQNSNKFVTSGAVYNALNGATIEGGGLSETELNELASLVVAEIGQADPVATGGATIDSVLETQELANKALANEADEYDNTDTYNVGDIVLYTDNSTYKCIAATTAGTDCEDTDYWAPVVIGDELENKVDKVSGKQLSTEDYTTAEKTKLAGLTNAVVSKTANGLTPQLPDETTTTKYLRQDGTWAVPPNDNTDTKVTQTAISTNANYEVLFSATADNTTRTEGAGKYSNLKFNPSTGNLQTTQINGVTVGTSPKFTDTTYTSSSASSGSSTVSLCTRGEKYTWNNKQDKLTFDTSPTSGSSNPVTSGGMYTAINNLQTSFQAGCNTIMQAVTAKGQTPASNSPSNIATAISNIQTGINEEDVLINGFSEDFLLNMTRSDFDKYKLSMLGNKVVLNHSVKTIPWIIIGYTHDNTSYTFDLWSSVSMYDSQQFSSYSGYYYNSSDIRTTINNMVSGFSSAVQGRLKTMAVASNGSTLNDKVKLLSLTEMGISTGDYHPGVEGSPYSNYFTTGRSVNVGQYSDLVRYNSSGSKVSYWTRSRSTYYGVNYVWYINPNGGASSYYPTSLYSVLPVIRISIG